MLTEKFKEIIVNSGISVQKIAEISGIPMRTIQNWLYRNTVPNLDSFEKITKSLGYKINLQKF